MARDEYSFTPEHKEELMGRTIRRAGEMRASERRRRRAVRASSGAVLVLLVAGGAIAFSLSGSSGKGGTTTPAGGPHTGAAATSTTTTSTIPPSHTKAEAIGPDFSPISFTAVSLDQWWVLGSVSCASGSCPQLLETTDGGTSFAVVGAPAGIDVQQGVLGGVRFGDATHGWAFGPGLWSTSNGGYSWTKVPVAGTVKDVEAGDGRAYALVCTTSSCSEMELLSAPISGGSFTKVSLPETLTEGASMSITGSTVLVSNGPASSGSKPVDFLVSTDGGSQFTAEASPCYAGLGGRAVTTVNGSSALWAACPTGMMAEGMISGDLGKSWSALTAGIEFTNDLQIAPVSASVALVGPYGDSAGLGLTTNGGKSFTKVLSGPSGSVVLWVAYSDSTRAYCLLSGGSSPGGDELMASNDGGSSWYRVQFAS